MQMEPFARALDSRLSRVLASAIPIIITSTGDLISTFARRATTLFGNSIIHVFPVSVHRTGTTSSSKSRVPVILRDIVSGEYRTQEPAKRITLFRGMKTALPALLLTHHSGGVICGFCATVQLRSTTELLRLDHHSRLE